MRKAHLTLLFFIFSILILGCIGYQPEKSFEEYFQASIEKNYKYRTIIKEYYKGKTILEVETLTTKYGDLLEGRTGSVTNGVYILYKKDIGAECYFNNLTSEIICDLVTNKSNEYIRGVIFDEKILNVKSTPTIRRVVYGKPTDCFKIEAENLDMVALKLLFGEKLIVKDIKGTICYYKDLEFPAYLYLNTKLENEITLKTIEFSLEATYKVESTETTLNDINPPAETKIAYNPYLIKCGKDRIIIPVFQLSKDPVNISIITYYTDPLNITLNQFAELQNITIEIPEDTLENYTEDLNYYINMGYLLIGDKTYPIDCY